MVRKFWPQRHQSRRSPLVKGRRRQIDRRKSTHLEPCGNAPVRDENPGPAHPRGYVPNSPSAASP